MYVHVGKSSSLTSSCPTVINIEEPWNKTAQHRLKKESSEVLCVSCGKDVTQSQDLLTENVEVEYSFQCQFCQEPKKREPANIGYVCSLCNVCFDTAVGLESHLSAHRMTY